MPKVIRASSNRLHMALVGILGGAIFAGCGDTSSSPRNQPSHTAIQSQSGAEEQPIKPPDEQHAAGSGINILWKERTDSGGVQTVLEMKAETGAIDAVAQSGALKDAAGRFFRGGKARAKFSAPEVIASRDKQTVLARGRVTVNSIDPPGVSLTANQITWYAERHQIVASGSVHISHTPKGASAPIAYGTVPQATANTELQVITVP